MLLDSLEGGWTIAHSGAVEGALATGAAAYALIQLALFAIVLVIVAIPPVRRVLTPGFVKRTHVHARAVELAAHRRHAIGAPASVIIYASTAERRIEIVADDAIHAKVGDAAWNEAMAAALAAIRRGDTVAGLIAAIERCGQALAEHFPADGALRPEPADDLTEV
jgi:putative membrane protein